MPAPETVTDATFATDVLASALPVLVDFWAPWCAPCRALTPLVEDLAERYRGRVKVAMLDVDAFPRLARDSSILGVPTLVLYDAGIEVERVVGPSSPEILAAILDRHLERRVARDAGPRRSTSPAT